MSLLMRFAFPKSFYILRNIKIDQSNAVRMESSFKGYSLDMCYQAFNNHVIKEI